MAQTYTLDEAAHRLAIPTEEFKRRLKDDWKQVRSFRDGATLRFRAADIDELARVMGGASDPGLQLGPVGGGDLPDVIDASSDDFVLGPDVPPPPSSKVGKARTGLKPPDDSGVKIHGESAPRRTDSEFALPTEDVSLDLSGPGSSIIRPNQLGKAVAAKPSGMIPKPSGMIPKPSGLIPRPTGSKIGPPPGTKGPKGTTGADSSSEFELSLDADSDSFEMQLTDEKSEMDLDSLELGPADPKGGGLSGIDLGKPADSGLSLEGKAPKPVPAQPKPSRVSPASKIGPKSRRPGLPVPHPTDPSSIDFELALDSGSSPGGYGNQQSESEFELSLEGGSPGADTGPKTAAPHSGSDVDVIETDFELPAVGDDDSQTDLDLTGATTEHSSSDFDLAISSDELEVIEGEESASEVVVVDDEALASEYSEEDVEPAITSGLMGEEEPRSVPGEVRYVPAAPAQWGVLPVAVLLPTLLLVFLGGLMSFELLRGMWGYHQPGKPSSLLLRGMADTFGLKVSD